MRRSRREPASGWGLRRSLASVSCADSRLLFRSEDKTHKCGPLALGSVSGTSGRKTPLLFSLKNRGGSHVERAPWQQGRPTSRGAEPAQSAIPRGPERAGVTGLAAPGGCPAAVGVGHPAGQSA